MAKRLNKSQDTEQPAQSVLDSMVPDAASRQPVADTAKPPRPKNKVDVADIDRADSEGMAQRQDRPQEREKPAVVAQGGLGDLNGGKGAGGQA